MENNNWEPIIGQEVVCLKTSHSRMGCQFIKGNRYTVADLWTCPGCKQLKILVKELIVKEKPEKRCCLFVGNSSVPLNAMGWVKYFAPVPPAYENISKELAEKAMEVKPEVDVPVKREVVNN